MKVADLEFILSSKLPMMERMAMVVIASYINEGQASAWPSIETIAMRGGMSTASAARSVAMLRKNGFIGVIRRFSKSTIYTINHVEGWSPIVSNGSYPADSIQQPVMADGYYQAASYGQQPVMSDRHDDHICQRKMIISNGSTILPEDYSTNEPTNILGNDKKVKDVDSGRIVPPTIEMVEEYCASEGNGIDAAAFVLHYGQSDWVLKNGRKMKNWKMAIGIWVKNSERFGGKSQPRRDTEDEPMRNTPEWFNYHADIEAKRLRAAQS